MGPIDSHVIRGYCIAGSVAVSNWNVFVCFIIFWRINKPYDLQNELPDYLCVVGEQRCCQRDPGQSKYASSYLAKYVIVNIA